MFFDNETRLHQLLNLITTVNGIDENTDGLIIGARKPPVVPAVSNAVNIPFIREIVWNAITNLIARNMIRPKPTDLCKEYVPTEIVYLTIRIQTDVITHDHSVEHDEVLALVHLTLALDKVHTLGAVEIFLGDKSRMPFTDIILTSLIAIPSIIEHEFITAYRSVVECRDNVLSNVFKFHYRN